MCIYIYIRIYGWVLKQISGIYLFEEELNCVNKDTFVGFIIAMDGLGLYKYFVNYFVTNYLGLAKQSLPERDAIEGIVSDL